MNLPDNIRQEIKATLASAYSREYDDYKRWEDAAKTLFREHETGTAEAAKRMADNLSRRLDGFTAAAEALGIDANELAQAAKEIGERGDA